MRTHTQAATSRSAARTLADHDRATAASQPELGGRAASLLRLQSTIGNRASTRLIQLARASAVAAGRSTGHGSAAPAAQAVRPGGSGQPLDPGVRSLMESRFGADFGTVRVHTDADAARSAGQLGALAYTIGPDVYFAAGQYRPETDRGRRLVAHELTHTLQQAGAAERPGPALSPSHHPAEREADRAAEAVTRGAAPAPPALHLPRSIQRQEGALLAFQADLEQRRRRVVSLTRDGGGSIGLHGDSATGKMSGYQLTQMFSLKLAPDARIDDYAIVQWIKGEMYEQRGANKVYWPANAGGALFGRGAKDPWFFTSWIVDTPDADPRFGSHTGLSITLPTTSIEDSPGIIITSGVLPAGLRWVVQARMGVYPWGHRIPTTISGWESQRPTPFQEISWGWDITVNADQKSLTVNFT
jgi:hypothetical protein